MSKSKFMRFEFDGLDFDGELMVLLKVFWVVYLFSRFALNTEAIILERAWSEVLHFLIKNF